MMSKETVEFSIKLPIFLEVGVRKKRKYFLNVNIFRNLPFHLNNSLKRQMKDVVLPLIPDEYRGVNLKHYELDYTLYLPSKLKRDVSNVCGVVDKFTCDALVEGGVLEDDNYNHLQKITYRYGGYDAKKKGYVILIVKEVEDGID